jgi:LCP family protein required for cell wall assembly
MLSTFHSDPRSHLAIFKLTLWLIAILTVWQINVMEVAAGSPPETSPQAEVTCPAWGETEATAESSSIAGGLLNSAAGMAMTLLPESTLSGRINILLLGSDSLAGDHYGHTDTMILATVDPISKTAGLLSIPRDLWVSIPGYGENRINQAYRLGVLNQHPGGGPGLVKETIEANLGVPVHHYVRIDFDGFKQLIDTLGGVEVCVPETIDAAAYYGYVPQFIDKANYYSYIPAEPVATGLADETVTTTNSLSQTTALDLENGYRFLYIEAGWHTLDGTSALRYARSRASITADFARVQRQQAVLLAMRKKALQINALPKIPDLWGAMSHIIETDLQLGDILQLARLAYEITPAQIQAGAISHDQTQGHRTSTGASVLLPKRAEIKLLVDQIFGSSNPTAPMTQAELEVFGQAAATVELTQTGQTLLVSP